MDDRQIITQIGNLAHEEQHLEELHVGKGSCLRRKRSGCRPSRSHWTACGTSCANARALRDAGRSPEEAGTRPEGTVEGYLR